MKYHLGCGSKILGGYYNIDSIERPGVGADKIINLLDMTFADDVEEIRSHHVFEHFGYVDSVYLLMKWGTVLDIGGVIRIEIPDIVAITDRFRIADIEEQTKIMRLLFGDQTNEFSFHKMMWTEEMLRNHLSKCGFDWIETKRTGCIKNKQPNLSMEISFKKTVQKESKELLEHACALLALLANAPYGRDKYEHYIAQLSWRLIKDGFQI